MERATKLLVIGWACAALAADVWLSRAWSGMPLATTLLFATAAGLTAFDRRGIALVLVFAYIYPAVIRLTLDSYAVQFSLLWLAPLLGAVVPDGLRSRWHIPARFRAALICAALTIAVATTIIALRETDFNLALLGPMPDAVLSGLPRYFAEWVVHVGLVLVLGILWFDWLIGARNLDFHASILAPLGVSLSIMALVAVYQMFVNMSFMNETIYAFQRPGGGHALRRQCVRHHRRHGHRRHRLLRRALPGLEAGGLAVRHVGVLAGGVGVRVADGLHGGGGCHRRLRHVVAAFGWRRHRDPNREACLAARPRRRRPAGAARQRRSDRHRTDSTPVAHDARGLGKHPVWCGCRVVESQAATAPPPPA